MATRWVNRPQADGQAGYPCVLRAAARPLRVVGGQPDRCPNFSSTMRPWSG